MQGTGKDTVADDFGLNKMYGYTHYSETNVADAYETMTRNKVRFPKDQVRFAATHAIEFYILGSNFILFLILIGSNFILFLVLIV